MVWDGKRTLCIDFDGVIHLYRSKWRGIEFIDDGPHEDAWDVLAEYLEHFHICIYSARSAEQIGISAMKEWFKKEGCPEETISKLQFPEKKPTAHIYLDDRAWQFNGEFPTVEEIKAFKPWNKR